MSKLSSAIILLVLLPGCAGGSLSVRMAIPMVDSQYAAISEETDPALARQAMPASLKMMEGMLKDDPGNPTLLKNLAEGYCGYAFSFVEDEDPERASRLYLRGRGYAERLLTAEGAPENLAAQNPGQFKNSLEGLKAQHLPGVFWMGQCWAQWLMLNLDDLQAFVAIPKVEALMQKAQGLNENYHHAGPHMFYGIFYGGRSKMLGGDPEKARNHFEKCLELTEQKYLMAHVMYAKTYAVQMQDPELFKKLLNTVLEAPDDILPGQQLANAVAKMKARKLLEAADDLF